MDRIKRVLGCAWASPVTLFALVYVCILRVMNWYSFVGVRGDALVWRVRLDKVPAWFAKAWNSWGGHTFGNVIVTKFDVDDQASRGPRTLVHELAHVHHYMRLGIFMLPVYGIIWLAIKVACKHSDPYFSNPFEVDARRAAGQFVDVEGAVARAVERGTFKQ